MADSSETVHAVANFLGVKCGKITYDGNERVPVMKGKTGTRKGLTAIVKHLVRAAEKTSLLGENLEEKAVVDQWLEYRACHLDRCPSSQERHVVCGELNRYLADKVYFLSHRLTLVDLVLLYGLHQTVNDLTFYDKQKFMHLSRWFDNVSNQVQSFDEIRQSLKPVHFSKTVLYSGSAH